MTTKKPELTDEEREEGLKFLSDVIDIVLTQLWRELPALLLAGRRAHKEALIVRYLTKQLS
jgi:hypothetical protein